MEFRDGGVGRNSAARWLRDLIHERTGIFFNDSNIDLMMDKVRSVMAECGDDSLLDYYYRLKYDNRDADWTDLLDGISVRETFFWREFDQIRALIDLVVPRLAPTLKEPLKIWSAACAAPSMRSRRS